MSHQSASTTTPDEKAKSLGLDLTPRGGERFFLNSCTRAGNLLFTSGHTCKLQGKLGENLTTEEGYAAAREAMAEVLRSVWLEVGSFNKLRVIKLLGCVNAAPNFIECSKVINGGTDLVHEIFGKFEAGYHSRSALGFSTLPNGVAVEIEAILEIVA